MPFDPYKTWLSIPTEEQPPNHYRLLNLELYVDDGDAILESIATRLAHIGQFDFGTFTPIVNRLRRELESAAECLLDAESKSAYDSRLQVENSLNEAKSPSPSPKDGKRSRPRPNQASGEQTTQQPKKPPIRKSRKSPQPKNKSRKTVSSRSRAGSSASQSKPAASQTKHTEQPKPARRNKIVVCSVGGILLIASCVFLATQFFGDDSPEPFTKLKVNPEAIPGVGTKNSDSTSEPKQSTAATESSQQVALGQDTESTEAAADKSASNATPSQIPTVASTDANAHSPPKSTVQQDDQTDNVDPEKTSASQATTESDPAADPVTISQTDTNPIVDADKPPDEPTTVAEPKIPPPQPRFPSDVVRRTYASHLRKLLNDGWKRGSKGREAAERNYRLAKNLGIDDPELEYAYGIVLLQHFKHDDALKHFTLATESKLYHHVPAWQSSVWVPAIKKKYPDAFERSIKLAEMLAQVESPWPMQMEKDQAARWLGRLMSFFEGPASTLSARARVIAQREPEILKALGQNYHQFYRQGKDDVSRELAELKNTDSQLREKEDAELKKQTDKKQEEIDGKQKKAKAKKDEIAKTVEQRKQKLDADLKKYGEQLQGLETAFNTYDAQITGIMKRSSDLNLTINQVEFRKENALRANAGAEAKRLQDESEQYRRQMNALRQQHSRMTNLIGQVKRKAMEVFVSRKSAIANYEKTTGQLVKQNASLQKWQLRLKAEEGRVKEKSKKGSQSARLRRSRLNALGTYIPLDLESERTRILESIPKP